MHSKQFKKSIQIFCNLKFLKYMSLGNSRELSYLNNQKILLFQKFPYMSIKIVTAFVCYLRLNKCLIIPELTFFFLCVSLWMSLMCLFGLLYTEPASAKPFYQEQQCKYIHNQSIWRTSFFCGNFCYSYDHLKRIRVFS